MSEADRWLMTLAAFWGTWQFLGHLWYLSHTRLRKLVCVGLTFIAKDVVVDDDQRVRQTSQLLDRSA